MSPDHMEDVAINLAVRELLELRRNAEIDPQADISLYVPWGIMGPDDYLKRTVFSHPQDPLASNSREQ